MPTLTLSGDDRLMTPQETAKVLGTSLSTLTRNRAGATDSVPTLAFVRIGRRSIRYRLSDVRAYLKACTTT
jgi:hypothetical protein